MEGIVINRLLGLAERVWVRRVSIIEHKTATDEFLAKDRKLRWVRPERVETLRSKDYREFSTRNWYFRRTIYQDREGNVLMVRTNDK